MDVLSQSFLKLKQLANTRGAMKCSQLNDVFLIEQISAFSTQLEKIGNQTKTLDSTVNNADWLSNNTGIKSFINESTNANSKNMY